MAKNQNGFATTAIIGVVVALAIIVVGLLVYNHNHGESKSSTTSQNSHSTQAQSSPQAGASTANSQQYLVIKELGIKLPLSSSIKDLVYTYNDMSGGTATSVQHLHFSTNSIKDIPSSGSTCSESRDPLGIYTVYTSRQSNEGTVDSQAGTLEASVNGYYIYYRHTQYACGDTSADQAKVAALIQPLLSSVQNAKAE